ncbi:16320_t:CDS:2, partial [Rhizophagus irregularis]
NLLIVGRTLSGKSTLSNVLCNTDDFSENEYIIKKDFEWNGLKYYMIEIVFGSIEKKVYNEIIDLMPEGISQVLFVVDKSFTTEEKIMLESYKRIIFETGILEYVTIIRNKFDDFSIKNECERDKKHVFEENEIITEIVKSCNNTIYINNPPIFTCDEDEIIVNRDIRKRSRAILLNYLEKECQEEYYKLENWDDLQSKIAGYSKLNKEFTEEVKKADNTTLISPDQNSTNPDDVNKKGNTSLKIPELSVGTIDINKSLSVGSDVNVLNNIEPESNSSLVSVAQPKMPDGKSKPRNTKSKEQEKFNTQYSKEKEIYIVGSRSILFSFFKSEFTKLEGSLEIEGFENLEIINLKDLKLNSLKINDCSQLNKVDLSELTKLTSLYVRDCPNLTTDDCSLIGLTSLKSLKIINCSQFKKIFDLSLFPELTSLETSGCSQLNQITGFSRLPKLTSLYVINCPKLTKLDCSSTKTLTELEVSDLEELNCSNTSIEELSLNLCPNITKLDCLNNKKLIKLDLSNCSYLDFLDCTGSKLTSLDLSYCSKSITVKPSDLIITRKLENFRNILLVGRTGGGKSTLANVLTDTSNFKERAYAVSQTKNFKKIDFKWNEENFRVVDTIGVGGTKQSTENTLFKIAEGILSMPEGLNHVLYVIDGRFTEEEISTFNMITDSIFKSGILDYVTIVRTKFSNFRDKRVCEVDIKKIREE